jgi:hypothetical protein
MGATLDKLYPLDYEDLELIETNKKRRDQRRE